MRRNTLSRTWKTALCLAVLIAAGALLLSAGPRAPHSTARAQDNPTPIQLQFPTPTATAGPPTETPTRTATSAGRPFVEAIQDATNVRAGPDINEDRVGQIYPGTRYAVLGKRFEWYWIEYPESPIGSAWVHNSVVTLSGDAALIPEVELDQIPTVDRLFIDQQGTAQAVQDTPGALATLTAQALITPTGFFTPEGASRSDAAARPAAPDLHLSAVSPSRRCWCRAPTPSSDDKTRASRRS